MQREKTATLLLLGTLIFIHGVVARHEALLLHRSVPTRPAALSVAFLAPNLQSTRRLPCTLKKAENLRFGRSSASPRCPDHLAVGKSSVTWTIKDLSRSRLWRGRAISAPPLRTSRFPFGGHKGFQLFFWPEGCKSSREGYAALQLVQREVHEPLLDMIYLFVGNREIGPVLFRSPEFFKACNSICKIEETRHDTLVVGARMKRAPLKQPLSRDENL